MALKLTAILQGGVEVAAAYHRVDRVVLNHKETVVAFVRAYKDADAAAAKNALGQEAGYSFDWPFDTTGAPVVVTNPESFAYTQLKTLPAFAAAIDHRRLEHPGSLANIVQAKTQVPTKFAYASALNRKRLSEVAEAFNEARKPLIEKYAAKDGDDKIIEKDGQVTLTDPAAFNAEVMALTEVETDVTLHKVLLGDFPEAIALADMEALMPMVAEETPA